MFNPLTHLNRFFDLATEQTLSGSDQLVYLHLFNKFNRAHWTETILVRDAELLELCRLYEPNGKPASIETIRNAKARLKKKGLIDFTAGKGNSPTRYSLPCLYPTDTPTDTPRNPYIRVREDVKTLDVKTLKEEGGAGAREIWEVFTGEMQRPSTASERYELVALVEKHGFAKVAAALKRTRRIRRYPTYQDFLDVLNDKPLKGGERHGKQNNDGYTDNYECEIPDYKKAPWRK